MDGIHISVNSLNKRMCRIIVMTIGLYGIKIFGMGLYLNRFS